MKLEKVEEIQQSLQDIYNKGIISNSFVIDKNYFRFYKFEENTTHLDIITNIIYKEEFVKISENSEEVEISFTLNDDKKIIRTLLECQPHPLSNFKSQWRSISIEDNIISTDFEHERNLKDDEATELIEKIYLIIQRSAKLLEESDDHKIYIPNTNLEDIPAGRVVIHKK